MRKPVQRNLRQYVLMKKLQEKPINKNVLETTIKIIGIVVTCGSIFLSFNTYRNTERWKKAEFSVAQFRKFQENKSVQLVNQMLDYDRKSLPLFADDSITIVDESIVAQAMILDTIKPYFSNEQSRIREVFDEHLDELSLFNRYYEEDIVDSAVLKPFLLYQIRAIADTSFRKNSTSIREVQSALWKYIDYYQFKEVQKLCVLFGFDIHPKKYPKIDEEADQNKNL